MARRIVLPSTSALVAVAVCCSLSACRKGNLASQTAETSASGLDARPGNRCGYSHSASKPLVVDWPAAERAALEARANQGPVAVRWEGCEIEVLTTCNGEGTYTYGGLNPKQETVRIKNADELYANLPVGAANLEGKLERFGSLEVDMVVIGRKEADQYRFRKSDLSGRCEGATHVVTGLTVGAFSFSAGQDAKVGAEARVGKAGVGAASSSSSELLNTDGDFNACKQAGQSDAEPPPGCGSLLRVEMVPVEGVGAVARSTGGGGSSAGPIHSGQSGVGGAGSGARDNGSMGSGPPPSSAEMVTLERKVKNGKIVYLSGYVGAVAFGLGSAVGFALVQTADEEIIQSFTDLEIRDDALQKRKTGQFLGWAGLGAAVASGVIGLAGLAAHNKAQAELNRVSVIGGPKKGGANFGVRVKF